MTSRVGLIGDPVAHSRSPAMHNAAFAQLGIAAHYELWLTPAAELAARVAALRAPDVLGANVTLPHKIAVLPLLDEVDPQAQAIGAVNTIVRGPDGALRGYNTDAPGFLASLRADAGYAPEGRAAVVLGASGAARAACAALLSAGTSHLTLINRTPEKAEALLGDLLLALDRGQLTGADDDVRLLALAPDDAADPLASASLLVNATSVGWHGAETPLPAALLHRGLVVYDMVYRETQLLRDAAARGARGCGGLGMLVRQAALAFSHWTGQVAPSDVMWRAVEGT